MSGIIIVIPVKMKLKLLLYFNFNKIYHIHKISKEKISLLPHK